MIHLVTLNEIPALVVAGVCRRLFTTFGVGAEPAGHRALAGEGNLDAAGLLADQKPATGFADDQTLFLTDRPLVLPEGPLGAAPAGGFADPDRGVAIVTTEGIPLPPPIGGDEDEAAWLAFAARLARRAVHQVGFLWRLHRCVDGRCAMYPPWVGEATAELCEFCRDRAEVHLRRARS